MPNERTRAVIQTGKFLLELSRDSSLPRAPSGSTPKIRQALPKSHGSN
ncbi:BPSL0761 family protein [Pseudomonas syringae]